MKYILILSYNGLQLKQGIGALFQPFFEVDDNVIFEV